MPRRKPAKRENGCGTVYKRSDLKHRPWVAAAPASLDGGRITRTVGGCYGVATYFHNERQKEKP